MTTYNNDLAVRDQVRANAETERGAVEHRSGAFQVGRRSFLRGAAGLTLPLPFLEMMSRPAHAASLAPKYFLAWHQGQGTQLNEWAIPGASETSFTLGKVLQPIAAHKDKMLFFRGIDNQVKELATGDGHQTAQTTCMTCQPNGGGPSFDQVLSTRIRKPGQRASLNLAAGNSARIRFYAGPGDKIESQGDPRKVLTTVFTTGGSSANELARLQARQKSILDAVRGNMTSFRTRLGREDQVRLDQHSDKIRELEVRYMQKATSSTCTSPMLNLPAGFNPSSAHGASAEAHIEILAMAFACNLTPVGTIEFTDDHNPPTHASFSSGFSDWHAMVHAGESQRGMSGLISGYAWYASLFAKLMQRFSEVQANGAPLIDQTVIQWTCDFGYGAGHNGLSVHAILAGSLGPNVKMGRLLQYTDSEKLWNESPWALNNYYVTILRAFGQTDMMFGKAAKATTKMGPLPGTF